MISVIMPVYNVEKYVSDCIESVLNQTYKNFELIIVNDGSTDNSLNEAKKYLCDSRVHIYSQENKGLSAARNTGLKCVKGDYIYFIDSDDVINQNLFDLLIGEFSNHQETDLISFGYTEFETGLSKINLGKHLVIKQSEILSSDQALQKLMDGQINQMAWSYIVRANIIVQNNIRFSNGRLFEDNNFAAKLFSACKSIIQIQFDPMPYLLRYRSSSITAIANNSYSLKELEDELFIFEDEYKTFMDCDDITCAKAPTWYFNKINEIYNKYYLSLYRNNSQRFFNIRKKSNHLHSKYTLNLSFRDRERWIRVNSRLFDRVIRIISGDRRKLK